MYLFISIRGHFPLSICGPSVHPSVDYAFVKMAKKWQNSPKTLALSVGGPQIEVQNQSINHSLNQSHTQSLIYRPGCSCPIKLSDGLSHVSAFLSFCEQFLLLPNRIRLMLLCIWPLPLTPAHEVHVYDLVRCTKRVCLFACLSIDPFVTLKLRSQK